MVFQLWELMAKDVDTARPVWAPAQLTLDSSTDFRIVLQGMATNGGFAVDDITFSDGPCPSKYFVTYQQPTMEILCFAIKYD